MSSNGRAPRREDIIAAFRPLARILERVIDDARGQTTIAVVRDAIPGVTRDSHRHRISGNVRWMLIADGLVDAGVAGEFPTGFAVESSELQHNSGQYIFRFPGGVFTVKRKPHKDEDEGVYLQERLEEILAETPFADGIDIRADLKVVVCVPPKAEARLIATHPTFDKPEVILVSELVRQVPAKLHSGERESALPRRSVRSKREAATPKSADTGASAPTS